MMDPVASVRPPSAPGAAANPARAMIRWISTSNPFYVISACLVFVGLKLMFGPPGGTIEAWGLMLALAAYTLLLAATAWALIRFADLWEDVRTILLLVVLMFLATSVTIDDTLVRDPGLGRSCYLVGLGFAVAVSEALLRGVGLALRAGFRGPYYATLALTFLYPVGVSPLLADADGPALSWALFGFSPLAGLVFLTLLPAARRGPEYVRDNGSPWCWPLYPWTLFGLLAFGICARTYALCISLQPASGFHRDSTIFGPYFLVPFLLALMVVLVEIGRGARSEGVQRFAVVVGGPAVTILAMAGQRPDPLYQGFLRTFSDGLGASPAYLTLVALVAIYAVLAARRVPMALGALAVTLTALAVVGPTTRDPGGLVAPRAWPLAAVAALQGFIAVRRRSAGRLLVASACAIASVSCALAGPPLAPYRGLIAYHLAIAAALAVGALGEDPCAELARIAGAWMLLLAGIAAIGTDPHRYSGVLAVAVPLYPLLVAAVAVGYGRLTRCPSYYAVGGIGLTGWLVCSGWQTYRDARRSVAGLDHLLLGMASFLLAAVISLSKAGLIRRWWARLNRWWASRMKARVGPMEV